MRMLLICHMILIFFYTQRNNLFSFRAYWLPKGRQNTLPFVAPAKGGICLAKATLDLIQDKSVLESWFDSRAFFFWYLKALPLPSLTDAAD